ncbi:hypothetical protein [Dolichospermum sp. UHCC 0406]|uniref:hypothetical protein n=1 Tax=Dolichospermum sp. UHCC 0406 TaxID=2590017 RepID=UPI0014489B51|nr:hypothetical protein [Dolichospermum sp. UHCC 0406]MTJ38619.1 hypothetical protein [Dolichospermum sp. UHCC 0406]
MKGVRSQESGVRSQESGVRSQEEEGRRKEEGGRRKLGNCNFYSLFPVPYSLFPNLRYNRKSANFMTAFINRRCFYGTYVL